jgi:hypothetical protein
VREKHRSSVFENRVPKRILGHKEKGSDRIMERIT